jgi:hypothetical protein
MDITGAQVLSERLAQQEQWREARAVRLGRQPSFDPDGWALESFADGVRIYRCEQRLEQRDGRSTWVTQRVRKILVDGVWESEVVVENVQQVA